MAYVSKIEPSAAEGLLKRIFDAAIARAGKVYQILAVQSLAPKALDASMGLYIATMHGKGELSRGDREMLAVVVSKVNGCHY
jgi:alkylhydroperoxidase family enzyme